MRNLKKVLSLTLALVMLIGMMVVGAGATSFKDEASINDEYKTAASVLDAIGVIEGTTLNGETNFNPKKVLTRVEGAAIIYRMVTSGLNKNPIADSGFVDVDGNPSHGWASGTVAACRDLGILSGVDATHFNPGGELTVAAFSKMLLVALGYETDKAEYSGANWESNVARDARARGILLNGLSMNSKLNREQAAQMAFQTLTAATVEYKGMNITVGDTTFNTPATVRYHDADDVSTNSTYDYKAPTATTTIKFCEEYFPTLKLVEDGDTFGRAIKEWRLRNITIAGTQTAVAADKVYTSEVKEADVKKEIGNVSEVGYRNSSGSWVAGAEIWTNGDCVTSQTVTPASIAKLTKDGVLVEVYLNEVDKKLVDKIVVVDTVRGDVAAVNSTKETFRVSYENIDGKKYTKTIDKDSEFAGLIGEVKKDDILAVVAKADGTIIDLYAPETIEGNVSYVKNGLASATVDGQTVNTYKKAQHFSKTLRQDVVAYMVNGYALAVTGAAKDPVKVGENYIYVTDVWTEGANKYSSNPVTKVGGFTADAKYVELTLADEDNAANTTAIKVVADWKNLSNSFNNTNIVQFEADSNTNVAAGKLLYVDNNDTDAGNKFAPGKAPTASGADKLIGHVCKYYNYDGDDNALKGTSLIGVPDTAEVKATAETAELKSNAYTMAAGSGTKYISDDVVMVWITGEKDKVAAEKTARKTISKVGGSEYWGVVEPGNSYVSVIFVHNNTWISDDSVYIAHVYDGFIKYNDAAGKEQSGWYVDYFTTGSDEVKQMTVTTEPKNVPGFYTTKADGDAFKIAADSTTYTDKIAKRMSDTIDNAILVVTKEAAPSTEEPINIANATFIDCVDPEDENSYGIMSREQFLDMLDGSGAQVRVSLHFTNGAVDTVYVVSSTTSKRIPTPTPVGNVATVEMETSGAFKGLTSTNKIIIKADIDDGEEHKLEITDVNTTQNLWACVAVFDYAGQYDDHVLTLYFDGTKVGQARVDKENAVGYAFYSAESIQSTSGVNYWQIKDGNTTIAQGTF